MNKIVETGKPLPEESPEPETDVLPDIAPPDTAVNNTADNENI